MFEIQADQTPNLPFTYLFMLTDYVIVYQQKDQQRRRKIHHLTVGGKLISTIELAGIYHDFSTFRVKGIYGVMIMQEIIL